MLVPLLYAVTLALSPLQEPDRLDKFLLSSGTLKEEVSIAGGELELLAEAYPASCISTETHLAMRTAQESLSPPITAPSASEIRSEQSGYGFRFAYNVALSPGRAFAGHWVEGYPTEGLGHVDLFELKAGEWKRSAELYPRERQLGSQFGRSLASLDGVLLVGAPRWSGKKQHEGAAYIFEFVGGRWTQTASLRNRVSKAIGWFGWSTALSADRAFVGSLVEGGSVEVFARRGDEWTSEAIITTRNSSEGRFGAILSADGESLAVSFDDRYKSGAVYVFDRLSNGEWKQSARLEAPRPWIGDQFGLALNLSRETLVVGAPRGWTEEDQDASVLIYRRRDQEWQLEAEFDFPTARQHTKLAVDVHDDHLVVGFSFGITSKLGGRARVFVREGGDWQYSRTLEASEPSHLDGFGSAVAADSHWILIGAPTIGDWMREENPEPSGAVYFFPSEP